VRANCACNNGWPVLGEDAVAAEDAVDAADVELLLA